jgi:hypothetical protein
VIRWLRSLFAWRVYDETWAWVHYRNTVTGAVRHMQKVQGVPMVPEQQYGGPIPPADED